MRLGLSVYVFMGFRLAPTAIQVILIKLICSSYIVLMQLQFSSHVAPFQLLQGSCIVPMQLQYSSNKAHINSSGGEGYIRGFIWGRGRHYPRAPQGDPRATQEHPNRRDHKMRSILGGKERLIIKNLEISEGRRELLIINNLKWFREAKLRS